MEFFYAFMDIFSNAGPKGKNRNFKFLRKINFHHTWAERYDTYTGKLTAEVICYVTLVSRFQINQT